MDLSKLANKLEKKFKKPIYYAIFLDEASEEKLLKWWVEKIQIPFLDRVYAEHLTIKFKPTDTDVALYTPMLESKTNIKIIGYAADDKGQAVLGLPEIESTNKYPHITISCANGVEPSYSKTLLENHTLINGPTISGVFFKKD
jgi:hypothetical protein